ncbi:hypothetical protein DQE84_15305, partial [Staphylococcus warneri]
VGADGGPAAAGSADRSGARRQGRADRYRRGTGAPVHRGGNGGRSARERTRVRRGACGGARGGRGGALGLEPLPADAHPHGTADGVRRQD